MFKKIKASQNGEITFQFTDVGKSCSIHVFLKSQIYLLYAISKNILNLQ